MKKRCSSALTMLQKMDFMKNLSILKGEVHPPRDRYRVSDMHNP